MVVLVVKLGPFAVGVIGQFRYIFGLGGVTNGTGVGLDSNIFVGSRNGDNTFVPGMGFGDFFLAVLAGLRVVFTVFFGPTIGGEAVAVVVRVQRELEHLRCGLDGAFSVCKQRAALGADVMRFHTLCHAGRGYFCNSVECVLAMLFENKVFGSN